MAVVPAQSPGFGYPRPDGSVRAVQHRGDTRHRAECPRRDRAQEGGTSSDGGRAVPRFDRRRRHHRRDASVFESVVTSIQDMHRYCHKLKQGKSVPQSNSKEEVQRQSQERFYTMASQIKLLLEIPERIWSSMEASQYLQATQLYLLCCHLHRQLHLEAGGPQYSPVLARFPILVRQVAAAGHFRSTILLDSKSVLRGRAVSDQAIAEALVSTMLLEDSSPRQALADFLLARKASIQQLLNQPQHGT
ncbi:conserved oligomeric Golgi complex subunit 1-like, partial [Oncorhynchus masou masou]|uniref:conserved oligomeric Golgi complex subunit 1-like n=1 Tax=Oncorhynchus masou masou TaxID=90313 RepID=UPI003184490A